MTVKELKCKDGYEFECNMSVEFDNYKYYDEWGCAYVWLDNIGVEYNFCIDNSTNEMINCCAIYKIEMNDKTDYMETDYDTFIHYEIDFNNENWESELENAMCKALVEFYNL